MQMSLEAHDKKGPDLLNLFTHFSKFITYKNYYCIVTLIYIKSITYYRNLHYSYKSLLKHVTLIVLKKYFICQARFFLIMLSKKNKEDKVIKKFTEKDYNRIQINVLQLN